MFTKQPAGEPFINRPPALISASDGQRAVEDRFIYLV
jgi:hypothetical protein